MSPVRVSNKQAYEEASRDPAFRHDMNADLEAFDATLADGLSPARPMTKLEGKERKAYPFEVILPKGIVTAE